MDLRREPLPRPRLLDATMYWSRRGGGVRRYVLAKRDWLARTRTWHHALLAPGADGLGAIDAGGLPLPRSGGYRLPLDWRSLSRRMVAAEPDVIEVGDPFAMAWAARDAGQRLGVPVVAFCHSNLPAVAAQFAPRMRLAQRAARALAAAQLRRAYAGFDAVLAPSRAMAGVLRDLGIERVEAQPLGVETARFHPSRRDPDGVRRDLGLPRDERLLLYAGRFAAEKHLPMLADAVRALGPGHRLVAVGHGPLPPRGPQVLSLPFETDAAALARLVASCDVFVHAGDQETFGLAVLEAMACGVPVAVRASAGLAELVDGGCGLGIDSLRAADWRDALAALLATPPAPAMLERARARAAAHDWQQVLPQMFTRYERLRSGDETAAAPYRGHRPRVAPG